MKNDELFNKNIPRTLKARLIVKGGVSEEIKKKWVEEDEEGWNVQLKSIRLRNQNKNERSQNNIRRRI